MQATLGQLSCMCQSVLAIPAELMSQSHADTSEARDRQDADFTYDVVIVDDGSSDGTMCQAFEQFRRHGFEAVRVPQLTWHHGKVHHQSLTSLCCSYCCPCRDSFLETLTRRGTALVQGYAVKAGIFVGRGELLLFMDADGATRVSDAEKLEAALATLLDSGDAASILGA